VRRERFDHLIEVEARRFLSNREFIAIPGANSEIPLLRRVGRHPGSWSL